jgi:hypothetical protein
MKYSTRRKLVRLPVKTIVVTGIVVLAVFFVIIYFLFDPTSSQLFPKCAFYTLTGYKCPGCGMQRMVHALLNGEIIEALRYNAFLMVVFPLAGLLLIIERYRNHFQRFYMWLSFSYIGIGFLIVTLLWWVLRNVFNW